MRTFAIGDVHGHAQELQDLLSMLSEEENFDPQKDHLVLLGDLVDSGPQVKQVLDWCIKFKETYPDTFHPLYGNHEDLLLDALSTNHPLYGDYYLWWYQGGKETVESYIDEELTDLERSLVHPEDVIPKEHLDFLRNLPRYHEDENYFYVHGGIYPDKLLKDHDFTDPKTLYDMIWIRDQFIRSDFRWEKKIVFGHSANTEYIEGKTDFMPIVMENKIGINTMPRHNQGYLTAVALPEELFIRINHDRSNTVS